MDYQLCQQQNDTKVAYNTNGTDQ